MLSKKLSIMAVAMFAISIMFAAVPAYSNDGAGDIVITDSIGREITIPGPVESIVTLGAGYTNTVIELGHKDKIVGVDFYSSYDYTKDPNHEGLENLGNFYTDVSAIYTALIQMRDAGKFGINDVVIAPNMSYITNDTGLLKLIEDNSIEIKVIIISATSYDEVISAVNTIGKVLGEENNSLVTNMQKVKDFIEKEVSDNGLSGAAGIHISSAGKVYNSSILSSMIEIAGGVNAGYDSEKSGSSYVADPAAIVQMSLVNENTTVFLDDGHSKTAAEYKDEMNLTCKVIKMDSKWNNLSPSAAEGLWAVASAMYPDVFPSDMPDFDEPKDNTLLYVTVGVIVAGILCIVAVLYLRRG